jgi:hypothetical protein
MRGGGLIEYTRSDVYPKVVVALGLEQGLANEILKFSPAMRGQKLDPDWLRSLQQLKEYERSFVS